MSDSRWRAQLADLGGVEICLSKSAKFLTAMPNPGFGAHGIFSSVSQMIVLLLTLSQNKSVQLSNKSAS